MMKKRTIFLTDYIANQYPIEKFKEIIFITIDIAENFLLTLESGFNYETSNILSYEEKYGSSHRNNSSKIESIFIKNMKEQEKMKKFLETFYNSYHSLNSEEKIIFDSTFINCLTDLEIIDKYKTHSKHIRMVRKSAIVRFCLKAGLDKFVDVI